MRKLLLILILTTYSLWSATNIFAQNWKDSAFSYQLQSNIYYGSATNFAGTYDSLKMDIYTPQCSNGSTSSKFPVIVWIHGGSFLTGSKNDQTIELLCKKFAQQGYVAVSINYRLGFIADEGLWQCNFPNYGCIFATDSAEWARAYHRAIQDANGAIHYLVNRKEELKIDVNNIFVGGESAGAITALGVALQEMPSERLPQTFAIADANQPNTATASCDYNVGKNLGTTIPRPDLGPIEGSIEPTTTPYTIKGVASIYGAMPANLLESIPAGKTKPAIYSFHQPCDIIVPIDSANVYWGLTWCMNNGYNCYGIANTNFKLYGPRAFTHWNTANNYGYNLHNEFTSVSFPYSFLIGQASCADQANNPCHAYDNFQLRAQNIANYFAPLITSTKPCDTTSVGLNDLEKVLQQMKVYPNPTKDAVTISTNENHSIENITLLDMMGKKVFAQHLKHPEKQITLQMNSMPNGVYQIVITTEQKQTLTTSIIKQ